VLLDTDLIRERRLALGLSQPALAKRVARSPTVISLLERGENHQRLTLDLVAALASALGLQTVDLFRPPASGALATEDDVKVEAALATTGKGLSTTDLAKGFDWGIDRVHAALAALRDRLAPTGVNLHQHAGKWYLRPRVPVLSRPEQQRIEGSRVARDRLSRYDAEVLAAVVGGAADGRWVVDASNARKVALAHLLRLGYIEPAEAGLAATAGVRFSLGLDRADSVEARRR
jgi:transcriptional regulator with XRE-family HTH domain